MRGIVILSALVVLAGSYSAQQQLEPGQEIMWRKLDLFHRMLDALVLDDFEALEAYSADLVALSRAGEWYILDTEEYRAESWELRGAATAIGSAAEGRNSGVAALACVDLTLRCVGCHRRLGEIPRR